MGKRITPMIYAVASELQTYEEAMGHTKPRKRKNSRAKGKRSELEARDLLRRCGITDAERGARNGVKSGSDIHSPMLAAKGWRVEVKNVAGMRLGNKLWLDACDQAIFDNPSKPNHWFVLWRPCRGEWAITYQTEHFWWASIVGEECIKRWIEDTIIQEGEV